MTIWLLDAQTISRIAAGEVIERPAAVVKELVENALDAGARTIHVAVRGGGLDLIRVRDDGCGMTADEVALAFARHATSKLRPGGALDEVTTLGFRGEALASIAAVADVTLYTRPAAARVGTKVRVVGGNVVACSPCAGGVGTTATVEGLFAHHPARRTFLRAPRQEMAALCEVVGAYVVAFPAVQWTLEVDGRTVLSASGCGDRRAALAAVLGPSVAAQLGSATAEDAASGARAWALAGPPTLSRATRAATLTYVNGRWVAGGPLEQTIGEVYRPLLGRQRYPIVALGVELPRGWVDPNVHPTKRVVRVEPEAEVRMLARRALEAALAATTTQTQSRAAGAIAYQLRLPGRAGKIVRHGDPEAVRVAEDAADYALAGRRLPPLCLLGQLGRAFMLAESDDGLLLIDQHRAHERVLYERLAGAIASGGAATQLLLHPFVVELTLAQAELVEAHLPELRRLGLELERFGPLTWLVRGVPGVIAGQPREVVAPALERAAAEGLAPAALERLALDLACRSALRSGRRLTLSEMRDLLLQLGATSQPYVCPHGGPIVLAISRELLEQQFGRRLRPPGGP